MCYHHQPSVYQGRPHPQTPVNLAHFVNRPEVLLVGRLSGAELPVVALVVSQPFFFLWVRIEGGDTLQEGFSSFNATFPYDLLDGEGYVLFDYVDEIVVRYPADLLEVYLFKHPCKILVPNNHTRLFEQSFEIVGLKHPVLIGIEQIEPVADVLA